MDICTVEVIATFNILKPFRFSGFDEVIFSFRKANLFSIAVYPEQGRRAMVNKFNADKREKNEVKIRIVK